MLGRIFIVFIRIYRYLVSPILGERCRFHPCCSDYAIEAIRSFGLVRGVFISLRRLIRCHPWCKGGFDPVPERFFT